MEKWRFIFAGAMLAGSQLVASSPALAVSGLALLPNAALLVGRNLTQTGCGNVIQPALGPGYTATMATGLAGASKSQAILGGQVSRLAMISQQQDAGASAALAKAPAISGAMLAPTTGTTNCGQLVLPSATNFVVSPGIERKPMGSEDFLASKRLAVKRTAFDAQWRRVSQGGVSQRLVSALAQTAPGGVSHATLAAVNSWTNARVRFVDDRVQFGRADYWSGAQATLRRGAGDCEDIAIAKMQLLAAIGVPRTNMYLTIARDLARNADHAMLVVRLDGSFWLLDNATNEVLDASRSYDYRPILSYNTAGKWLHGY